MVTVITDEIVVTVWLVVVTVKVDNVDLVIELVVTMVVVTVVSEVAVLVVTVEGVVEGSDKLLAFEWSDMLCVSTLLIIPGSDADSDSIGSGSVVIEYTGLVDSLSLLIPDSKLVVIGSVNDESSANSLELGSESVGELVD